MFKAFLLLALMAYASVFIPPKGHDYFVEVMETVNARADNENYLRDNQANLLGVFKEKTKARVIRISDLPSGNYGLEVMPEGDLNAKSVWIYYDKNNPKVQLFKDKNYKEKIEDPKQALSIIAKNEQPSVTDPDFDRWYKIELADAKAECLKVNTKAKCENVKVKGKYAKNADLLSEPKAVDSANQKHRQAIRAKIQKCAVTHQLGAIKDLNKDTASAADYCRMNRLHNVVYANPKVGLQDEPGKVPFERKRNTQYSLSRVDKSVLISLAMPIYVHPNADPKTVFKVNSCAPLMSQFMERYGMKLNVVFDIKDSSQRPKPEKNTLEDGVLLVKGEGASDRRVLYTESAVRPVGCITDCSSSLKNPGCHKYCHNELAERNFCIQMLRSTLDNLGLNPEYQRSNKPAYCSDETINRRKLSSILEERTSPLHAMELMPEHVEALTKELCSAPPSTPENKINGTK